MLPQYNLLVEIKDKHQFYRKQTRIGKEPAKSAAAKAYAKSIG